MDHVEKTLLMDVNDAYVYVQSARRAVMEFGGAGESWTKTFCDNIQGRLLGEDVASVAEAVEERLEQRQVELVRQVQGGLSDVDRLVAEVYISKVIQPGRTSFKTDYKKLYEPGRDYSQTMRDRCAQLGNDELSDDMQANLELRRKRINRESVR